mmetsp:Transcript_56398/g.150871  ORF Transcript_56398/g.150871 Transcript_56398/m.150871 type:complete len:438 (-) Transcript_56398:54-1367(-)
MKRVILIRHGESVAQAVPRQERWNPNATFLRDAPLGEAGESQVLNLASLPNTSVELVVCSPLTRALQTAIGVFGKLGVRVIVHPNLREVPSKHFGAEGAPMQQECLGRTVQELRADSRLQRDFLDWSVMLDEPDVWWSETVDSPSVVDNRLSALGQWLVDRPESCIAVVCHFNVIQRLTKTNHMVHNCSPIHCNLDGKWTVVADCGHLDTSLRSAERGGHEAQGQAPAKVDRTGAQCARAPRAKPRRNPKILQGAFLVNHGSFNPPHLGHLAMMVAARRRLESEGFRVEVGFLAMTCTAHILSKGAVAFPEDVREKLCRILCGTTDWMLFDDRGVLNTSSRRMIPTLEQEHPGLVGFSVLGADTAARYRPRRDAVVVARVGSEPIEEHRGNRVFCTPNADPQTGDFSSTKVRNALERGDLHAVAELCGEEAAAILVG